MPRMYQGRWGRAVQAMSGSDWFLNVVGPRVVPHVDRLVHRLSGGRRTMSGGMVPVLLLTTTGRKSGQPRTTPLATMPDGDGFYVLGSNFGKDNHPAWSLNLLANPEASVSFRGRDLPVRARLVEPAEFAQIATKVHRFWPQYDKYTERSGRALRLFRLDPR